MALPLILVVAILTANHVPATWRNLYFLAAFGGVLSVIFIIPIREQLRARAREGLNAPGFSRKLEAAAKALRSLASEAEEALRLGDEMPDPSPALRSVVAELRRVAQSQDKRELLPSFDFRYATPSQLRDAAGHLEAYALSVRARGGIFQLTTTQLLLGAAATLAGFLWGWRLVLRYWNHPSWSFFGGVALIAASVVIAYGLWGSQRDAA